MQDNLLMVNHLTTEFHTDNGILKAIDDISFFCEKGRDSRSGWRIRLREKRYFDVDSSTNS